MTPSRSELPVSDSTQRVSGDDAQAMNLAAAGAVADAVRTTLGPDGMDKLLVDRSGNVVVTNDGATLVAEMDVSHPAAVAIADVAATQEAQAGDGTTTAVVLAGELLAVAESLLEEDLHPTTVVDGYRLAARRAIETLRTLARPVGPDDVTTLERVAATALTGTTSASDRDHLASMVVSAVLTALEETGRVDEEAVVVRSFPGASLDASRFVPGVLLDLDPCHPGMPTTQSEAAVLVYEGDVEVAESSADAGATVTDFGEYAAFVDGEHAELDDAVDRVVAAGADVLLTSGGIEPRARERLVDAGVTAFYRVDEDKRERVARATGAERVADLEGLSGTALGGVGRLTQETIRELTHKHQAPSERTMVFADLPTDTVGTILLRGGTDHALTEAERAVEDAVDVVVAALEDGAILPGAGAPEAEIAHTLRGMDAIDGREQHAVEAFADAVEVVPRTIAENGGHDVVDALLALRSRHSAGERFAGFDPATGSVVDAIGAGVVEPLRVRTTAIAGAVDAATGILRIDDVVSAGDLSVNGEED